MAAFTTVLSTTSSVDDSIILAYEQSFLVACGQEQNLDQFATVKKNIGAKSIQIPKYSRLAVSTTALTETDDVASVALADAPIVLTPAEYGNVVTRTSLASLQTGGTVDVAAAQLVGINAGMVQDALAIAALDASTNSYIIAGTAAGSVTSGQVASKVFLNYFYNKLSRTNVPKIGGMYVAIMHDDVINDLRADTTVNGSWTDVAKYAGAREVFANEVGEFGGFRIVRNNASTFADQTGAGTVDLYNSYFLGMNGLGKAVSKDVGLTFSGPFDKLGRFVNVGWYGVMQYKIVDTDAVWMGQCASSVGANAS